MLHNYGNKQNNRKRSSQNKQGQTRIHFPTALRTMIRKASVVHSTHSNLAGDVYSTL